MRTKFDAIFFGSMSFFKYCVFFEQRLSSELENEPNLVDADVRAELQSLALRDGVLFQYLGALLLELGRATLTLTMGTSPVCIIDQYFVN